MATLAALPIIDTCIRDRDTTSVKWVRVVGDMTSADAVVEIAGRLRSACVSISRLIIDASNLHELDTKFIALLVDLYRRAKSCGIAVEILASPAVRKWLTICRLESLVD